MAPHRLWVLLVLGHYADVTTPALYGRDINLYWDFRYMPDVAAMVARAAPLWLLALGDHRRCGLIVGAVLSRVSDGRSARIAAAARCECPRARVAMGMRP